MPTYNSIQTASVQAIANLKGVAQFGDRDTAPPMATALETAIQSFIANPAASGIKSDAGEPGQSGEDDLRLTMRTGHQS